MMILRIALCSGLLLPAACSRKQDASATAPQLPATNQTPVTTAPINTNEPAVRNIVAAPTNPPSVQPAPVSVPGQKQYDEAVALFRHAQGSEDLEVTVKLFRESAELGNAAAQQALGVLYFAGLGVPKNPEEAIAWWNKSASQGNADAEFKLASILIRGDNVPADETRALELLRAAADQGHADAQYNLATLYATGKHVSKDPQEASNWFRKAAESGHPTAQSNLGVLYATGQLGEKNMEEAVRWWQKASEQGQPSAMFNLAQALVEGKAVPKDLVEAYKWSNLAADQGDQDAAALRTAIATEISPSELGDALKRSRQFKSDLQSRVTDRREKLL